MSFQYNNPKWKIIPHINHHNLYTKKTLLTPFSGFNVPTLKYPQVWGETTDSTHNILFKSVSYCIMIQIIRVFIFLFCKIKKYIICLQIKFYAAIETLFEFLHNVDRGRKHGIEGIVLKFESKMAFTTNVVVTEHRIMAGAFMISLTHNFFIDPPPPHSCLFFVLR